MSNNEEEFKKNFNKLEIYLKNNFYKGKYKSFSSMIENLSECNPIINEYSKDLYALNNLRNAIAHGDSSSYYAIPTDETIQRLKRILDKFINPKVIGKFSNINPIFAYDNETLSVAIDKMILNDFSQLPVLNDGKLIGMISLEKTANFLWINRNSTYNFENIKIIDESARAVLDDNFIIMDMNSEIVSVLSKFDSMERTEKPIMAIFISDSITSKIIGIITQYDINRLYKEIKI